MSKWNERNVKRNETDEPLENEKGIYDGVDLIYVCGSISIRELNQGGPYAYVLVSDIADSEIEAYESALTTLETLADECREVLEELKGGE